MLLPAVLYGCEIWCLSSEEQILRIFQIEVLRRIFGSERAKEKYQYYIILLRQLNKM
jgi:hypothetical protein